MAFFSYKRLIFIFMIYNAFVLIGAAVMMYIESLAKDEVKIERQTNYTLMKEYLELKLNMNISFENITEIHSQLSSNFTITSTKKKSSWRKEISLSTYFRWKSFSEVSISTIGKLFKFLRFSFILK